MQVYTCTASAAGGAGGGGGAGGAGGSGATTYSWVLKQPDAVLYDSSFAQVGTHGLGPNWTSTDGSVVNGAKIAGANSTMTGAIQWLLLQASSTYGHRRVHRHHLRPAAEHRRRPGAGQRLRRDQRRDGHPHPVLRRLLLLHRRDGGPADGGTGGGGDSGGGGGGGGTSG